VVARGHPTGSEGVPDELWPGRAGKTLSSGHHTIQFASQRARKRNPCMTLPQPVGTHFWLGPEPPEESWKLCTGSNRQGACRSTAHTLPPYLILEKLRESIDLSTKNVFGLGNTIHRDKILKRFGNVPLKFRSAKLRRIMSEQLDIFQMLQKINNQKPPAFVISTIHVLFLYFRRQD